MKRYKQRWNVVDDVLNHETTVEELVNSLRTLEKLTDKYPNDDYLLGSIDILRDEVCHMFGGSVNPDDYFDPETIDYRTNKVYEIDKDDDVECKGQHLD